MHYFALALATCYYPRSTESHIVCLAIPRPEGESAAYNGLYGEAPPKRATFFPCGVLPGPPYDGLCEEAPPERGTFSRLQVHERVGISLVDVYKRVGKSVIWVCKRAQKG